MFTLEENTLFYMLYHFFKLSIALVLTNDSCILSKTFRCKSIILLNPNYYDIVVFKLLHIEEVMEQAFLLLNIIFSDLPSNY